MRQRSLFRAIEPTHIVPRPYQMRAVEAVEKKLYDQKYPSTLGVAATGTGKTLIAGYLARRQAAKFGGRTLFLAHRIGLVNQAASSFVEMGLEVGVEQGPNYGLAANDPHAICASRDSLQGERLLRYPKDYFGLIICDEAHRSMVGSNANIFAHFDAPVLGITATPKPELGSIYKSQAFRYTIKDALEDPDGPFLVRPVFVYCDVKVDLSNLRVQGAADFTDADLNEILLPHVGPIALAVKQNVGDRTTVGFAPMIVTAQRFAAACQSLGMSAEWTSGEDPDQEDKLRRFKAGEIQVMWNSALLTEGTDIPSVECIAMCRPTRDWALYTQIVGRGLRLCPEISKEKCRVLEFNWNDLRKQLAREVDLVYGDMNIPGPDGDKVRERAGQLVRSGQEDDIIKAVERAVQDVKVEKITKALDFHIKDTGEIFRTIEWSPFPGYIAAGLPTEFPKEMKPQPASPKQIEFLRSMGVPVGPGLSKLRASAILDELVDRRNKGLATQKQISLLLREGFDPARVRNITKDEASKRIQEILDIKRGVAR